MAYDPMDGLRSAIAHKYRITGEAGRGGMATVFRAEDLKHKREVAVKVLSPALSVSIGALRFQREIRVTAGLRHPHILPVFDSGEAGGLLYYVMPFVEGETLRDRINRNSHLPVEDAIQVVADVADALGYAHLRGVIHRDVKPDNIVMDQGHAVVGDFGIAHAAIEPGEKLTATGVSVGTLEYMAPEQFDGNDVDARTDVYALGCVLYEMLAGRAPFSGGSAMEIMSRHVSEPVPRISLVRAHVPLDVEQVVYRALEKAPADRFQSMDEFRGALARASRNLGVSVRLRQTGDHRRGAFQSRHWYRRRAVLAAIATLLVVGAAVGAMALSGGEKASLNANKVAVLYFQRDSASDSLQFLADALTEGLIAQLSSETGLEVNSRVAVGKYREFGLDSVSAVAGHLGAGTILRGTVRSDRDHIEARVTLLDASGRILNGTTIRHRSTQLFALHDSVVSSAAHFLRQRLGRRVTPHHLGGRTRSVDAWIFATRAERRRKDAERLFAIDSVQEALKALSHADALLENAERLDPEWPDAPTARGRLAMLRATAFRRLRDPVVGRVGLETAIAHANRALALNPRHAEALELRGAAQWLRVPFRLVDSASMRVVLDSAELDLLAAVNIRPTQATAWATLSNIHFRTGDVGMANAAAEKAYRADPHLPGAEEILRRLFWSYYDREHFDDARRWCIDEGYGRLPTNPFAFECQLWLHTAPRQTMHNDPEHAWALLDSLLKYAPPGLRGFLEKRGEILVAGSLARAGLGDSSRRVLTRASQNARQVDPEGELAGDEAFVRVILGDRTEAIRLVKEYLAANPDHRRAFASDGGWWWRDLQTDPDFRRFLKAP